MRFQIAQALTLKPTYGENVVCRAIVYPILALILILAEEEEVFKVIYLLFKEL